MSERKVLTKYYPPDFDPSKITRTPKHLLADKANKLATVRLMAPFSMKCTSCGEYIYKGRKFNARKETTSETYLKLPIYRFYIRCTRCSSEITFKTDPKNMDYACERGAKRNFEAWRDPASAELQETDEQRLERLEREEAEEGEQAERDAMEELEGKMRENQREMRIADALDEIRTRNARIERGMGKEEEALNRVKDEVEEERKRLEREDEEAARRAFENRQMLQEIEEESEEVKNEPADGEVRDDAAPGDQAPPVASFQRVKKEKKPILNGLVKKSGTTPESQGGASMRQQAPTPAPPDSFKRPDAPAQRRLQIPPPTNGAGLGLAGYGSDSD